MRDWNIQYDDVLFDGDKADIDTVIARQSACDGCDQLNENKICGACGTSGCDMTFRSQLRSATCPLDRW